VFARAEVEASTKLREAVREWVGGLRLAPARETADTYLRTWLAGTEPTLRPRTADR
jgi:hypothetical protein